MPKISLSYDAYPSSLEIGQSTNYFWVIENSSFPIYGVNKDDFRFTPTNGGGYVGHIAYTLSSGSSYWGTSAQFSFNASSGTGTKGRAFFGFAKSGDE
jgi:hypothetical protein